MSCDGLAMEIPSLLPACILLAFFSVFGQCCVPAVIGQKYILNSTANVEQNEVVAWQLGSKTVFYRDIYGDGGNDYPLLYVGTTTQVTILNVSINDTSGVFTHSVNGVPVYNCTLPIYKRARTPTCEKVEFEENYLKTTCTTTEVFPQAKCQFTLENGEMDRKNITEETSNIAYTPTNPQPGRNEYYSTSCTLQYPVNGLKPGNWTVQVNMYPDLTGVSLAQGTTRQVNNSVQLSVPTVNMDPESCPKGLVEEGDTNVRDGYIRQGERASCLCTRGHAGNPLGNVSWSSTQGGSFDILSQRKDAATIQISAPDNFTCRSTTVLDGTHSMTYTPKYAYGPTNASVTFQPPGPFYLCPNQQTNITVTCQVPENSVNPGLLFVIREGRDDIARDKLGDTAWSKSGNYSLTRSGHHVFLCRAENEIFRDIFIVNETILHVYPHIYVTGTSVKKDEYGTWVRPGSRITVQCLVGQYNDLPDHSINLKCGQKTSTSGRLSVTVSSDMTCQCDVEHNTTTLCNGDHLTENITIRMALSNRTLSELEDSFPTGAVVGGAVGGFVALAVVVVGVFFCVRRGKKKNANSSDESVYNNPTHDSTEVDNSDLYSPYSPYEPSPSVTAKDDDHQPTTTSTTDLTEHYNPGLNPYDYIDQEELNGEKKLFATNPEAKATTGAKPNRPQVPQPNVKIKAKPKPPETENKDHVTTEATGGPPLQSAHVYVELEDEKKQQLATSEETDGPAQHSPDDNDEVYLNYQAKNETDSLASKDVLAEGTEGPAQHSPNDENQMYLNYKAKNKTDKANL